MQQVDQVLIPVANVEPGMFPSEAAVTVIASDGNTLTLFADNRLIVERGPQRYLRVTRLEQRSGIGDQRMSPSIRFRRGNAVDPDPQ